MWDDITCPFLYFNGTIFEGWGGINDFISYFIGDVVGDYLTMLGLKLTHINERGPMCWEVTLNDIPDIIDKYHSCTHFLGCTTYIKPYPYMACRRCSNYIFIFDLTPGFNLLGKNTSKTIRETFKFGNLPYTKGLTVYKILANSFFNTKHPLPK